MSRENLARKAEEARAALVNLAAAAAKVPKLKLDLLRSIELLEELSVRARSDEAALDTFTAGEMLSRALPSGLQVSVGVLPELKGPVTSPEFLAHEIKIRASLAKENGRKGGKKRSEAQVATFPKNFAKRREKLGERKKARAGRTENPATDSPGTSLV